MNKTFYVVLTIVLLIALIFLFFVTYVKNKKIKDPNEDKKMDCGNCNNYSCVYNKKKEG